MMQRLSSQSTLHRNIQMPLQEKPVTWLDVLVNGFFIGSDFAILHSYGTLFLVISLALLGASLIFNQHRRGGRLVPNNFRWGLAAKLGFGLLALNVLIIASQNSYLAGLKPGMKVLVAEAAFLGILASAVWRASQDYLRSTLMALVFAMSWFAFLNLVADKLGIAVEASMERETYFTSHFNQGSFRWQTPLYSAGQISGLLRWTIPITVLLCLWHIRRDRLIGGLLLLSLVPTMIVAVLCEFRAAIFPLIGAVAWLLAGNIILRAILSLFFAVYTVAIPFVITHDFASQFLQDYTPAFLLRLAGGQDILGVLTLSGRSTIWEGGLEALERGKYFWIGQGHVLMDAAKDVGQDAAAAQIFVRLGYHQGMLDIIFIYGVLLGGTLILLFFGGMLRGLLLLFRTEQRSPQTETVSIALFSLGMVALTNCHDGFFLEHNFFYFVSVISLCAVSDSCVRRATVFPRNPRPMLPRPRSRA